MNKYLMTFTVEAVQLRAETRDEICSRVNAEGFKVFKTYVDPSDRGMFSTVPTAIVGLLYFPKTGKNKLFVEGDYIVFNENDLYALSEEDFQRMTVKI